MTTADSSSWSEFDAEASLIQIREINAAFSDDKQLYHYTDIRGLYGVLESGHLWATHMAYLNDSQEIEHGISAICRIIDERATWLEQNPEKTTSPGSVEFVVELYRAMSDGLAAFTDSLKSTLAPFVACLSRSRDQLSQWRGYANGGYAIAFDPEALEKSLTVVDGNGLPMDENAAPRLTKVDYLESQVSEEVEQIIEDRLNGAYAEVTSSADVQAPDSEQKFIDDVISVISKLKHRKFNEEHEYRVIAHCHESFYTESPLGLIPRAKIGFDKKAVREVIVGPASFADLRKASIERYLADRTGEFGNVQVLPSLIPYRDF